MKLVKLFAAMLLAVCFVSVGCNKETTPPPAETTGIDSGTPTNQGDTSAEHPEGTDADGNPVEEGKADSDEGGEAAAPAEEAKEAAPAEEAKK